MMASERREKAPGNVANINVVLTGVGKHPGLEPKNMRLLVAEVRDGVVELRVPLTAIVRKS
jgi:hypothetical protein